ncbi:NAD(P)-binding protein [Catenulispora yoronensis]
MRILIAGAGIGGLAAARALIADGHEVSVYERADELRTSGSALTLWSNGTAVLHALGVPREGLGAPLDVLAVQRGRDGRQLMAVDVARAAARYGHPHLSMPRRDLIHRLAEGLPPGTVHFGKQVIGVVGSEVGGQPSPSPSPTALLLRPPSPPTSSSAPTATAPPSVPTSAPTSPAPIRPGPPAGPPSRA